MTIRKRIISLLMAVLMMLSISLCAPATVFAVDNSIINSRFAKVLQDQLDEMVANSNELRGTKKTLQITQISKISDFDNNTYTLVDCAPNGYMIYHDNSGIFVESSPVVNSPFYGKSGSYKYAGPNEYYIINDNSVCRNVLSGAVVDSTTKTKLVSKSASINQTLIENKNGYILDYINRRSNMSLGKIYELEKENTPARSVQVGDWTCVKNYPFFMNLNNCGYISGGKCGYIAAGMLLTYDKICNGKNTVDAVTHYTYSNGAVAINTALPTALYAKGVNLGYGASTTSVAIHYTVEAWLADRGITVNHTSLYVPIAGNDIVANKIRNNRPTIWFGYINDQTFNSTTGNHAVVVYGYKYGQLTGYNFVAHFGWSNATEVYFTGILGSVYTYEW